MKKKYAMTLLEIMIVIFIIGIIGSVVGYNMRGSLDKGKVFKTKEGGKKLYEIVQLENAQENKLLKRFEDGDDPSTIISGMLKNSGLVRNPKDLMKDGWGEEYVFEMDKDGFRYHSDKYEAYCEKNNIEPEYPWEDKDDASHS